MSLVAYASSDEGESSDADEIPEASSESQTTSDLDKINTQENGQDKSISRSRSISSDKRASGNDDVATEYSFPIEDDEYDILPNQTRGLTLPPPKHGTESKPSTSVTQDIPSSILLVLPAPQVKTSKVTGFDEEDELEDEVKPKAKQLADVPLPPSKQKKKKGVKITIPSLDDYDSDEDQPSKKKFKPSQGKSGLFSMLPAPKHASAKEVGRVLLPHSLSKKPASTTQVTKKLPNKTVSMSSEYRGVQVENTDVREDSDEDNESINFFSLGQDEKPVGPSVGPSVENFSATSKDSATRLLHEPSLRGPWLGPAAPASDLLGPPLKPTTASLSSNRNEGTLSNLGDKYITTSATIRKNVENVDESTVASAGSSDMEGPVYMAEYSNEQNYPEVGEVQSFIHDEEFLKLQGKKARGKEEINIIDVSGDDQMSQVDLMKHMTEEQDMRSYSKKGKDMPSAQQRRKHQITYLAFQAKERELELKNAWSQNRQTRRQTQSKYGF